MKNIYEMPRLDYIAFAVSAIISTSVDGLPLDGGMDEEEAF